MGPALAREARIRTKAVRNVTVFRGMAALQLRLFSAMRILHNSFNVNAFDRKHDIIS